MKRFWLLTALGTVLLVPASSMLAKQPETTTAFRLIETIGDTAITGDTAIETVRWNGRRYWNRGYYGPYMNRYYNYRPYTYRYYDYRPNAYRYYYNYPGYYYGVRPYGYYNYGYRGGVRIGPFGVWW